MELVVHILFLLAAAALLLQVSLWNRLPRTLFAAGTGVLTYGVYPWVIEQSRNELQQWLNDPGFMQDLAAVQTAEALLFLGAGLVLIGGRPAGKIVRWLHYFPGVIVFAGIIYLQIHLFYRFSSWEFARLASVYSIAVVPGLIGASYGVKKLIPEKELRMELRYLIHFFQIFIAMVITVYCHKFPYRAQEITFTWQPFVVVTTVCVLLFTAGLIRYNMLLKKD